MTMKNRNLPLLIAHCSLLILFACATVATGPDELDVAIRDTSDYLNDNIPKGSKIVILNIQSDYAALSEYIIDELIANAVNDKMFSIVDRAQLDQIRMELNFQLSGEVSEESALSIGRFLGAQTIVSGAISELDGRHRMRIRALNVQTAEVQGQYNRNINASKTLTALLKGGKTTAATYSGRTANTSGSTATDNGRTAIGSGATGTAQAATPTAPAAIANGIYTFYPRPRAMREGRGINLYLDKIVVRGGYFNMYFVASPVGENGSLDIGWWGNANIGLIYNLDQPNRPPLVSAKLESNGYDRGGIYTFSNHNVRRFRFEQTETDSSNYSPRVFEEINLDDAEYTP